MKLTKAQERAKSKLTDKWMSAYDVQESIPTLEGLVRRKVAESRRSVLGAIYSPRTGILFRLTTNAEQCAYCEGTGVDPESFRSAFEMQCPACAVTPNVEVSGLRGFLRRSARLKC